LYPAAQYVPSLFVNFHEATSSAQRFFCVAEALCWAVGKAIRPGFIQAAMAMLVMARIRRVRAVLLALEARFLAGLLRTPVARVAAARDVMAVRERAPPVATERLPRRFAWLCPLVPGEAACFAGQLRVVLAEPGMQTLLAACPQALRVLRPLCVMLGIERADYVPGFAAAMAAKAAMPKVVRVRVRRKSWSEEDQAREDAHYAITQVPRRFRLRVV
jgi:hypothetical protein